MSTRHIRKLLGGNELPPPDSDDDFEPLCAQTSSQSKYEGLVVSSHSESENQASDENKPAESVGDGAKKKKKKKKGKSRKPKQNQAANEGPNLEDLDEIDRSVLEVNRLLGALPASPVDEKEKEKKEECPIHITMVAHHRFLIVNNELNRLFGPDVPEEKRDKNRSRLSLMERLSRKMYLIEPKPFLTQLAKQGLSMSINREQDGLIYFTFDHDSAYQKYHRRNLISSVVAMDYQSGIAEARKKMYVEGLIQGVDAMFNREQNFEAASLLEEIVAYLQLVSHASFVLYDPKVRLEFKFPENRPFFVAMLKHIHILSNTACHRTALELAKVLLNLEPNDPYAMLFILDVLALRAREHQWLIEAINYWDGPRDAKRMLNMQYSYALCHYHILSKEKEPDLTRADELLRNAIISFPATVLHLMELTSYKPDDYIKKHPLLTTFAESTTPKSVRDVGRIYALFACHKWRDPSILKWFVANVRKLLQDYDADTNLQKLVKQVSENRCCLYPLLPTQIMRHLCTIRSMAKLLLDHDLPCELPMTSAWNPLQRIDETVHRYNYQPAEARQSLNYERSALFSLFRSIIPNFGIPQPGNGGAGAGADIRVRPIDPGDEMGLAEGGEDPIMAAIANGDYPPFDFEIYTGGSDSEGG